MYEPIFKLKIKADAGIETAVWEIKKREQDMKILPLSGISGEKICLMMTEELMNTVQNLQMIYKKVSKKNKVKDIILLDAYHSATIEGARTTVENVRNTFSKPKTKDDKMVINTVKGCNYAYQNLIDEASIRTLWEIVVENVCENESKAGTMYRDGMVFIGNESRIIHVPAKPENLPDMMKKLFWFLENEDMDVILKAFVLHFYFVYLHPFCDGNGRTARIWTASYLYHNGYEKMMYLPLSRTINENLSGYYGNLTDSEWKYEKQGQKYLEITPFIFYMLEIFEKCMITSILEENELTDKQKTLLIKMKKRGSGAEITVKNAGKILGETEENTKEVLQTLLEIGYLYKTVKDDSEIYILK